MAYPIGVFFKSLFTEAIPRLFKKLFSGAEKPPSVVVTFGDNNNGVTYVFNGPSQSDLACFGSLGVSPVADAAVMRIVADDQTCGG